MHPKRFKLNFTLNQNSQNEKITYLQYILRKIHCCIVKSSNLSIILPFCAKKYLKHLKYLEAQTHKMGTKRACVQCWPFQNTSF